MSTKTQEKKDVEVIDPEVGTITVDGIPCRVNRLKTREILGLLRVLGNGLGPALGEIRLDFSDEEQVATDLVALLALALPNAADEFAAFLTAIVSPIEAGKNTAVEAYLSDNPDVEVLLDVFEIVAVQEKDDLTALMGKAQAMWSRVAPLYTKRQDKKTAKKKAG